MKKKTENPKVISKDSLPWHLGLGLLDKKSVVFSKGTLTANYTFDNEILYKVSIDNTRSHITEFLDGQPKAYTSGEEKFEIIFFKHLQSELPYKSQLFERLYHKLTDGRNINVIFATQPRFLYFPSGYLFSLRQPIISANQSIFSAIEQKLAESTNENLNPITKRDGAILKLLKNGTVSTEQVMIVDFSSTLFHLAESVDYLWASGIVPKQIEYRLNVLDSSMTPPGNITVYLGDYDRGFITYSIVLTQGADLSIQQIQTIFKERSMTLFDRQQK